MTAPSSVSTTLPAQQAAPFPLMAAIAARTSRIEIGTGVIDMRYENPLYMAEQAAATDLISDGRLQIGVSRGSPEPAANGAADFGYHPLDGETVADMARRHTAAFRHAISGAGVAEPGEHAYMGGERLLRIEPQSPGLSRAYLVGCRLPRHRGLGCAAGHELDEFNAAHRGHGRAV